MPDQHTYDYAVIRVVPRVEREEFVNAGVVVSCPAMKFLAALIELDEARVSALDPEVDLAAVRAHLRSLAAICAGGPEAGPIGLLSAKERFRWVTSPRSTIIQTSPAHTGTSSDPAAVLEHLLCAMVRTTRA